MFSKVCIFCLDKPCQDGQLFFKTKTNKVFRCPYHNNYWNKDEYLPITKQEIEELKIEYNSYFDKINLPKI